MAHDLLFQSARALPNGRKLERTRASASALLAALFIVCCSEACEDHSAAQFLSRCLESPAVGSYVAGAGSEGIASAVAPERALRGCAELTGFTSSETSLAILRDGRVIVAPVITDEGTGLLRYDNTGPRVLLPSARGGVRHDRVQPYMHLEPMSETILFATANGAGFDLSRSRDAGDTWESSVFAGGTIDWLKMASGPSADSTSATTIFASSPAPISTAFADHQQVLISKDEGRTWTRVDGDQLSLRPERNGCASTEWVIYGGGVVDRDGALYLGLRRCARLGVAVTRDQGSSWKVTDVPGASLVPYGGLGSHFTSFNLMVSEPLAVDEMGTLYAVWNDDHDALRLSVSRDHAVTWSAPVAIAPPGVSRTVFADLAVRAPGVLAVAFYGSTDQGESWHGFVAESHNALDPFPAMVALRLTEEPLFRAGFDIGYTEIATGGDLVEMVRVAYAPNGDLWASFAKDMCPGMDRSHCLWDPLEHADGTYQLVMARLQHKDEPP